MADVEVKGVDGASAAIKLLVEAGTDIKFGNVMFYRSGVKYRLLKFNKNSNLIHNEEENFDEIDKATARFVELSGGKLI